MNKRLPNEPTFPDQDTLRTWENMRKEILHDLQEGASADVPDSEIDEVGILVVELESIQAQRKLHMPEELKRSIIALAKNTN
jgi:hypothetical protein